MEYKANKELTANARELRKNMTKEERHLWYDFLKAYPVRFLRQKVIGKYIVDFYCAKAKLVIELDGSQHFDDTELKYDEQRTEYLSQFDIEVIRIPNNEINLNLAGVCEFIDLAVKAKLN